MGVMNAVGDIIAGFPGSVRMIGVPKFDAAIASTSRTGVWGVGSSGSVRGDATLPSVEDAVGVGAWSSGKDISSVPSDDKERGGKDSGRGNVVKSRDHLVNPSLILMYLSFIDKISSEACCIYWFIKYEMLTHPSQ